MSAERFVDPEVTQAVEEIEDALRTERRALGPLPGENAELREKIERLTTERDQLRSDLEGLRQGRAKGLPRLPEALAPPLRVVPYVPMRRRLREALPLLTPLGVLVLFGRGQLGAWVLILALVAVAWVVARVVDVSRSRPWWGLKEDGFEAGGKGETSFVRYSEISSVEVQVTASQRRRGVGTVHVKCELKGEERPLKFLTLKDVPEPERLAAWLQAKRLERAWEAG
jgi:hypothetical protein